MLLSTVVNNHGSTSIGVIHSMIESTKYTLGLLIPLYHSPAFIHSLVMFISWFELLNNAVELGILVTVIIINKFTADIVHVCLPIPKILIKKCLILHVLYLLSEVNERLFYYLEKEESLLSMSLQAGLRIMSH